MPPVVTTVVLLVLSNVFMTFAWYAHLRNLSERPWYIAAVVSWGIARLNTCFKSRRTGLDIRQLSV
jgi:uncharacterized protein (DUF486 family)